MSETIIRSKVEKCFDTDAPLYWSDELLYHDMPPHAAGNCVIGWADLMSATVYKDVQDIMIEDEHVIVRGDFKPLLASLEAEGIAIERIEQSNDKHDPSILCSIFMLERVVDGKGYKYVMSCNPMTNKFAVLFLQEKVGV